MTKRDELIRSYCKPFSKRHVVIPTGLEYAILCNGKSVKRKDIQEVRARYISCGRCIRMEGIE